MCVSVGKYEPVVCTGNGRILSPARVVVRMEAIAFPPARREPAETACAT
jgi:hypothetical protein